jgi:hypothetical protein
MTIAPYAYMLAFGLVLIIALIILDTLEKHTMHRYITHDNPRYLTCAECSQTFDTANPRDAAELATGHDCEAPDTIADVFHRHNLRHDDTPRGHQAH